ncbi:DUF3060 domain-containing protein [Marinomonas atlantica]|uniref:DUF3060 domain-containing protein n=1 Tax=Marinomonas atlantica TaxID=1806668 RepID=UPI00082C4129|nr:DUF3060 domain-containing protein [Marinomonas atlantica]
MKLQVTESAVSDLTARGEYVFVERAVGSLYVTFVKDGQSKTTEISQGEQLRGSFDSIQFQAKETSQEIEFRIGWGEFTPNITAVTSTQIAGINDAVTVQKIIEQVTVSGIASEVAVSGITNEVAVSGITNEVAVSGITNEVAVSGITNEVAVSGITNEVAVSGITNEVAVSGITNAVTVTDNTGDSFVSTDYTVLANDYIDIPARDRSQIVFQNMSESTTKCRVSDTAETEAVGMWVIGGGSLFGESPILRTKSALRIWNTSSVDAVVTVTEVY